MLCRFPYAYREDAIRSEGRTDTAQIALQSALRALLTR